VWEKVLRLLWTSKMDDVSVDGGRVVTEDARSVYVASDARCKLGVVAY